MKKILQIKLILIFILTLMIGGDGFLLSKSKSKSKVRYFSPGSFYIYVLGSYNHFSPLDEYFLELGPDSADALSPVLGVGFRVVNIRDRFFINIEGDYAPATYDFGEYARDQKINTLTLMLNIAGRIWSKKLPLIVYGGIGVGFHHLSDLGYVDLLGDFISGGDDTITVMAFDLGIKIPISRSLFVRTEFQWNGEVYGDYECYCEYEEWGDTQWDFMSSSFSVGIEFHF